MPEKKLTFVPLEKPTAKKKEEPKTPKPTPQKKEAVEEKDVEPIDAPTTEEVPVAEPAKPSAKKGKAILVAEDEKPLSRALELKLTNQGYKVFTAFDGEEAVEMLKANKIDLAILDIVMPKLDGFGVLEKIKELKIKVHAVVISNLSQDEDKTKALSLGASEYFIKSDIPISDIVSYVTKTLNA